VGGKHDDVSVLPAPSPAGPAVDADGGGTEVTMLPEAVRRPRLTASQVSALRALEAKG